MRLTWRDVEVRPGLPIYTSLTTAEAAELGRLAKDRRVLEVGSAYGYSGLVMLTAGAEELWAVDPHVTHDSLGAFQANVDAAGFTSKVRTIVGTSQQAASLRYAGPSIGAGASVPERYFGMVFIDGDHTREGVLHDVEWARRLVKPYGAVIACHDYDESTCPGVKQALDELGLTWRRPSYMVDTLAVYSDPR